jgi:hypothetical protein
MANYANNYFPSQVVSDLEKMSLEYGLKVAQAIEREWFNETYSTNRYYTNKQEFHKLRLYARGEQSIQKYKDELSINGDLSYLNLDWKPVPIIPKFVDILVNGMSNRTYKIKATSQDPYGMNKRTSYMEAILEDMRTKDLAKFSKDRFKVNIFNTPEDKLPETQEELDLHMQLTYKQSVELANEQAINVLLEGNKYELIKKRFYYDLAVLGMACVKTSFNTSEGVKVQYVDPADLVYSYTDSPYFDDIYYVGEVKTIPINEVAKEFPHLTESELKEITQQYNVSTGKYSAYQGRGEKYQDENKVKLLYFNYKTFMNDVYKIKSLPSGGEKAIEKNDQFNPPEDKQVNFTRLSKKVETLFEGVLVLGTDKILKWQQAKNMIRPKSDYNKVQMNYSIVAPRMYNGKIDSLVKRITGFADMIQLTHLKLQQVMSRMIPDGIYLDADGLAEIDLGNGTNYNPQEALNMFFQTGSVIGRSMNELGEPNQGRIPIQEIASGSGGQKMQSLIQTYNYYLQMIRDVTGLNEAKDASTPDRNALVGIQKLAAANSNTATRHILQAGLFLSQSVAEQLSLRISDLLEFSPTRDAFIQAIGVHNVGTLEDVKSLYLYDFGISLELTPDDEEKQLLENNIQQSLQQQAIDLEDAIDLREIKNIKLANQLLKIRRKKKIERDQRMQQENIQAQAKANAQAQQVAAQAEVQKSQALVETQIQLEQAKTQMKAEMLSQEANVKKELMNYEFQINMQLKQMELNINKQREDNKEDRKDRRTKIQASQQSELIDQRKTGKPPKNFESSGNDTLGGFGLNNFEPR